jgi:type I restriction enzyme S subunit
MSVTKWFSFRRPLPEEIPSGWEAKRLREMATFAGGGRLGLTMSDYVADGFDAYTAEGCNGKAPVAEFEGPAVIVSSIGSLCGKSFLATGKFTTLANVQVVFPDQSQIDPYFLWLLLNDQEFWVRGQTGQPFIRPSDIKKAWIPKPPEPEQKALRPVFENLDLAMAATRESIAKAERLQNGLMQQLLTGRLKPDGTPRHEGDFGSDDRLGLFPKGWKVRKLHQVVRLRNGKSNITSNLRAEADTTFCYPVFGGNGMTGWSDRYLLDAPTVVLGRVGEYCGVVHRTPAKAWVTDNALYASEFPEPLDLGFLFYLLAHLQLNRWKAITGQPKITQSEILNIRAAIPSDTDEQADIATRLDGVRQLIDAKHAKIAALQRLKKSLMQNLLTGRIRLPVDGAVKPHNLAATESNLKGVTDAAIVQ